MIIYLLVAAIVAIEPTKLPDVMANEQGVSLRQVQIEWDAAGNPKTFRALVLTDKPRDWPGLEFDIELGKVDDAKTSTCGVYTVINEKPFRSTGAFSGDVLLVSKSAKCGSEAITYSLFADTRQREIDRKNKAAKAAAELVAEAERKRIAQFCPNLRARIANKRIADLTVAESDRMAACKTLGLW